MTERFKASELDRVINYCEQLAAQARRAKDKAGPATLQALSLHRIACALEEMADELGDTVRIVPPDEDDDDAGDAGDAGDATEGQVTP